MGEVKRTRRRRLIQFERKGFKGILTKCSPELAEKFRSYILEGLPVAKICDLLGIPMRTYSYWLERGQEYISAEESEIEDDWTDRQKQNGERMSNFYRTIRAAQAEWQLNILREDVNTRDYHYWMRAMSVLERRDRKHWARPTASREEELKEPSVKLDPSFL